MPRPGRYLRRALALLLAVGAARLLAAQAAPDQPQPTFRTGVDLIRLDVTVVTREGVPVGDLDAEDFEVRVDGQPAPVRTLRFLDLHTGPVGVPSGMSLASSRGYSANDVSVSGRLLTIVVDQDSFPAGSVRTLLANAGRLFAGLGPADRVSLVTVPPPGPRVDFTADTRAVLAGLERINGRSASRLRTYRVSFEEAAQMERRNSLVTAAVMDRECSFRSRRASCLEEVATEARMVLLEGRERIQMVLASLSGLTESLGQIEGPKTLIFITGGLGFDDTELSRFQEVARRAAEARLQCSFIQAATFGFDVSEAPQSAAQMIGRDQEGLDMLTGMTGGVLYKGVGTAAGVFERIERESRGAYVLGVEPPRRAASGDALQVDVRVRRRDITVRTPRQVLPGSRTAPSRDVRSAIGLLLRQPRPATALPLRLSTYSVRGDDLRRLKLIVSVQLPGGDVPASEVAWGLEVLDGEHIVADAFSEPTAGPGQAAREPGDTIVTAVPVPPGQYTLRFAALDGVGRRGSVEHRVAVGLRDAGEVQLSDLIAGVEHGERFEPQLQVTASGTPIRLILEVYGADEARLDTASVEFAFRSPDGTSLAATRVTAAATDTARRRVAQATLAIPDVPPGTYSAAATVLVGGRPVGRVTRSVLVGPPGQP